MDACEVGKAPTGYVALGSLSAAATTVLAAGLIWTGHAGSVWVSPHKLPVLGVVVAATVLSLRFPIDVRPRTRAYVSSIPLSLLAVLFPPLLAGIAAGLSQAIGELMMRSQRGNSLGCIAVQSCRWVVVAGAGSWVAHLSTGHGDLRDVPVVAGLAVLWLGDMLTCPLALWPLVREAPWRIVPAVIREAGLLEGAQYLVGLVGALLVRQELWTVVLLVLPTILVYLAFRSAREVRESTRSMLETMADAVDLRDPYTGGHSRRVAELCRQILAETNPGGPEGTLIVDAARVHDIGKIGIPDSVLNKPDRLTEEEWELMATHPVRGAELLGRYSDFARGREIVAHHHERWDGRGYPDGLAGTRIPFGARVIAVADSYDSMTSDRPYRRGMAPMEAAQVLRRGRGTQWDPELVDAFLRTVEGSVEAVRPQLRVVGGDSTALAVG